jgi:hypothetical protein
MILTLRPAAAKKLIGGGRWGPESLDTGVLRTMSGD